MIKFEQVPTDTLLPALEAFAMASGFGILPDEDEDANEDWMNGLRAAIAAALSAWPGMHTGPNIYGRQDAIMHLPLPAQEKTDAET